MDYSKLMVTWGLLLDVIRNRSTKGTRICIFQPLNFDVSKLMNYSNQILYSDMDFVGGPERA